MSVWPLVLSSRRVLISPKLLFTPGVLGCVFFSSSLSLGRGRSLWLQVVLRSDARREALRRTVDKLEKEQAGLEEALSAKDKSVSKGKDAEPFLLAEQQKAEQVASALDALYLRREELDDLSGGAPEPRARKARQRSSPPPPPPHRGPRGVLKKTK